MRRWCAHTPRRLKQLGGFSPLTPSNRSADIDRIFRAPQDVVGHHPSVRQVNVLTELDRNHFGIDLYDGALQPIAHAMFTFFVIAQHLDAISYCEIIL
jgi:hypothetical protein